MVTLQPFWEADPVEYLVRRKFPQLPPFGPAAVRAATLLSDEEFSALLDQAQAYREELWGLSQADLQSLIAEARQEEIRQNNERQEAEERKLLFNQPGAKADFAHWACASFWTLDEATALSFGKDPRVVTWGAISPFVRISPFAKDFEARRDLIHRAGVMGQLAAQTAPSFVLAWAERMKIPMPAELVEAVRGLGVQIADWKTLYDQSAARAEQLQEELNGEQANHLATLKAHSEFISKMKVGQDDLIAGYLRMISERDETIASLEVHAQDLTHRVAELEAAPPVAIAEKPLHARERDSLLKLIIGMAIKGYGFNPQAARSPVAKEIADDLALIGVSLDQDTVRKYLAEARELLSGDETEQSR